jgi:hypothetical protein
MWLVLPFPDREFANDQLAMNNHIATKTVRDEASEFFLAFWWGCAIMLNAKNARNHAGNRCSGGADLFGTMASFWAIRRLRISPAYEQGRG